MQYGQYMDNLNKNMNLINMGQNSAAMTGNAGMSMASNVAQQYGNIGQAQAMGAMAPFQSIMAIGNTGSENVRRRYVLMQVLTMAVWLPMLLISLVTH